MKRYRFTTKRPLRFYMCGEYGPSTNRPHYHACIFGHNFSDRTPLSRSHSGNVVFTSDLLSTLWTFGTSTVQDFTAKSAAYTARYITEKITGDQAEHFYSSVDADGVVHQLVPPFNRMSLRPGIGARWFDQFGTDIYPHDYVIADGSKRQSPKYYDRRRKAEAPQSFEDETQLARFKRAKLNPGESSPARLAVREEVTRARIKQQKRAAI